MRIAFVSPTASGLFADTLEYTGGAEVQQFLLAKALARLGHEAVFVVADRPGLRGPGAAAPGVRHIPMAFSLSARTPWERAANTRALWEALAQTDADLFVQKGAGLLTLEVALFARTVGRAFVYVVASDDEWARRFQHTGAPRHFLFRQGARLADAVVAQTNHQREQVARRWGVSARAIPEGIPIDPARAAPRERAVLWAATLRWYKRPECVLDLAERLPDVAFWVAGGPWIGDGERDARAAERFRARAAALPNVRGFGLMPHARLRELQRRAAVFLNTSLFEGFPQTFLEAWAEGTPVATLGVDPDEVICRHGLGFHTTTADDLAGALRRLLDDEPLRRQMGELGRAYVRTHHDLERTANEYEKLFGDLCACRAPSH